MRRGLTCAVVAVCCGCAQQSVPDPRAAAQAYADAAQRGDADAIYGMLSEEGQRTHGPEGTEKLVKDAKAELAAQGKALSSPATEIRSRARVRYADGEEAALELEHGRFLVAASGVFPAGARTPAEALGELRAALARRSYSQLMRVLSSETRSAVESDLRSLVEGLEEPETLDIRVTGDTAEVTLPGGHVVKLKREEGVWRVEDFD